MPILDHFHPPLSVQRYWITFHHAWASTIARQLNRHILPEEYFAAPSFQFGPRVEIDVANFEEVSGAARAADSSTLTYAAPLATVVVPFVFLDTVSVQIFYQEGGPKLVAALELVSPANKDRPDHRRAFTAKMASYLHQGIFLSVVDLVTDRTAHLHNEWIDSFQIPAGKMPDKLKPRLYANSYRPMQKGEQAELAMWLNPLAVGDSLPNLPLFLRSDLCFEIPLEDTYIETCADQRIALP